MPFGARALAREHGARWDKARKAHVYVGDELPPGLQMFRPQSFSWEAWLDAEINDRPHESYDGTGAVQVRPHQQLGAQAIVAARQAGRSGFLVADETGLGKTYLAIAAIAEMADIANALVVCPKSVRPAWRKSLKTYGTVGKSWCIQNPESLKKLVDTPDSAHRVKRQRTKNKHIAERGEAIQSWDVVVFDESAAYRNPTTQRSKLARRMGQGAFQIWMSATAGQTPLELSYLAPLLGEVTGKRVEDLEQFEQWCAGVGIGVSRGEYGKWEWVRNDDDLTLMRQMLLEPDEHGIRAGIRRRPSDIAGWPEQQRIAVPVELDAEGRLLYDELWTEFRRQMELQQRGKNPTGVLAAITRFRQKASLLRVDGVAGLIEELVDDGYQVAVSVAWHESMERLTDDLHFDDLVVMHGGQGEVEREASRLAFQRGDARVILFTPTEGFSLHATEDVANGVKRATVIHDVRWTAIEARQIEGRCHRDGERADVYYTYAEDTIEEFVLERCLERVVSMGEMQGDDIDEVSQMLAAMADFDFGNPPAG